MSSKVRILLPPRIFKKISSGCSSVGRATAFQAVGRRFEPGHPLRLIVIKFEFLELIVPNLGLSPLKAISRRSSEVERFLGKEKVMGSIPIVGSTLNFGANIVVFKLYCNELS